MKVFLVFIFSSVLWAQSSIQLGFGGITPHFSGKKKNYCNQWNNTGIIVNKTYYLSLLYKKYGITFMTGDDSICSKVDGIFLNYVFKKSQWNELGVTIGGYAYNRDNWIEHAKNTPEGITAPGPVTTDIGNKTVVPVLGLQWAVHLIRSSNWSLKLNNIFTPVIFNHSVAFEYRF